jgi:hypothetical protein
MGFFFREFITPFRKFSKDSVACKMTGSVGPQRRRSFTYCSKVACGYCLSAKSRIRANPKRWGMSLDPWGRTVQVTCPTFHVVGIKTLWCQKQAQETENLDKAISFDQEGASMCSLPLSKHLSTKWLTVAPSLCP